MKRSPSPAPSPLPSPERLLAGRRQGRGVTGSFPMQVLPSFFGLYSEKELLSHEQIGCQATKPIKNANNQLFLQKKFICFYLREEVQYPK
jgi:hypothetical protein